MNETNDKPQTLLSTRDRKLIEYWRWAFSDLRMNDVRGVYAEWMVAKILGIDPPPRDSWDSCDLRFDGICIEVKAASYVQAWPQKVPSKIIFTGLRGRVWDSNTGFAPTQTYNADIYIFCLQIEKNSEKWDALNLDQWRFYVLPRDVIETRNYTQISLAPLKQLARELHATELKGEVLSMRSA